MLSSEILKLRKINNVSKYFRYEKDKIVFIGDQLDLYIPARLEVHDMFESGEHVDTLACFDMVFDDKVRTGFYYPTKIIINHSEVEKVNIDALEYQRVTLYHGDVFCASRSTIRLSSAAYAIFVEFITRGKVPYFLNYENSHQLFDLAKSVCDAKLNTPHVIFELFESHLWRCKSNKAIQYRHRKTDNEVEQRIPLRSVAMATTSTSAKIFGSYKNEGIPSALLDDPTENHSMEDLLRQ